LFREFSAPNTKSREWWGMFVDFSDVDDEPLDEASRRSGSATTTMNNKTTNPLTQP
jgi:hypothetical protein